MATLAARGGVALDAGGIAYALEHHRDSPPFNPAAPLGGADGLQFKSFDGNCGISTTGRIYCRSSPTAFSEIQKPR